MNELDRYGLEWGPIHGDATLDNLHVTDDGQIILYDFDSGGPGWRASDLQGWAKNDTEYDGQMENVQEGYRSIRELKEVDLQAAPLLHLSWEIWGIKVDLEQRILKQGTGEDCFLYSGAVTFTSGESGNFTFLVTRSMIPSCNSPFCTTL